MVVIIKKSASDNTIFRGSNNKNRDTRSESIDSFSSTIDANAPSKKDDLLSPSFDALDEVVDVGYDSASAVHQFCLVSDNNDGDEGVHFDLVPSSSNHEIEDTAHNEQHHHLREALSSIVVLNSPLCKKVKSILETYDGHLVDIGPHLLEGLHSVAPKSLAARVGDWNENLFYEMQDFEKDIETIILDGPSRGGGDHGSRNNDVPKIDRQALNQDVQEFESILRKALKKSNLTYRGSFMQTEQTIPQPAHVDYDYPILKEHGEKLFLAFFPLTEEGAYLQLWKDEATTTPSTSKEKEMLLSTVDGTVVFIPYGKMFIVPSQTIHGGGFKRGKGGNLRFHLYIAIHEDGEEESDVDNSELLYHPMNKYTEEHDRRRELCERFVDANGLDGLLGVFFDDKF